MKFFQPQLHLVRDRQLDQPDIYYLHVVTFCPRSSFRANGYSVSDAQLQQEGVLSVTLQLKQDPGLPDFDSVTPVVHTIDLGAVPFPGAEGWVDVEVLGTVLETTGEGEPGAEKVSKPKTGGKGTVSTTHASEKARPGSDEFL